MTATQSSPYNPNKLRAIHLTCKRTDVRRTHRKEIPDRTNFKDKQRRRRHRDYPPITTTYYHHKQQRLNTIARFLRQLAAVIHHNLIKLRRLRELFASSYVLPVPVWVFNCAAARNDFWFGDRSLFLQPGLLVVCLRWSENQNKTSTLSLNNTIVISLGHQH